MSCENCEESAYVIDKLAKLLAEIAVIVNGVEPHDTSWSYHDLPEKVRALKQAPPAALAGPADRYTVDAVAWEEFIADWRQYVAGDPKMPFFRVREGLVAVIDSAQQAQQPAAAVPEVNYFDAQRIADEYRLPFNAFCAAHRAMLAAAEREGVES